MAGWTRLVRMARTGRTGVMLALSIAPAWALAAEQQQPADRVATEKHIEPQADRLLRQMTDYLSQLQNFQVTSSTVDEVVTKDGRKLQVSSDHSVYVSRPDRLRSEQLGGIAGALAFRDDGKTMILYCGADSTYGTAPAPPTIDATIDTLRQKYKIDAPGADLLYSHPYDVLTEQVTGGQFVGKETVDGVPANHLAFQGDEVDWQIWIQDGPTPVPLRYSITTKNMKGEPEFSVRLSRWQPQASFAEEVFRAEPPAGAKRIASFPVSCGGAGGGAPPGQQQ